MEFGTGLEIGVMHKMTLFCTLQQIHDALWEGLIMYYAQLSWAHMSCFKIPLGPVPE